MNGDIEKREMACPYCGLPVGVVIEWGDGDPYFNPNSHDLDGEPDEGRCPGATQDEWAEAYHEYLDGAAAVDEDRRLHSHLDGDDDVD